ncbi:DnaA regulatory inactivator Hda [Kaarinaea lacus]
MPKQIPLGFSFNNEITFDSFVIGENAEPVKSVQGLGVGGNEHFIYLWGKQGSGKSHLLQALCQTYSEQKKPAAFLALREKDQYSPLILDGLELLSLVCIDDVNAVAGNSIWEEALFHFFNRAHDRKTPLIITGSAPPAQLSLKLDDLKSRLGWGLVLQLKPLQDDQKLVALQTRAGLRGLELSKEVGQYLLSRYSRDLGELFALLDRLDHVSLSEQRRLTIPFLRQHI